MEPPPLATHTLHNSKKRLFTRNTSGSSASIMDAEIIEIPPPMYSKSKALEHKAVTHHEIIDIEKDDDSDDLMVIDVKTVSDTKGKKAVPGFHAASAVLNGFQSSKSAPQLDNLSGSGKFGSNFPITEDLDQDEWYEDEYALLQAHFDSIDIPTGVEAAIPWWPLSVESKEQADSATSSLYSSSSSLADAGIWKVNRSQAVRFDEPLQTAKSASKYFCGDAKPVSSTSSSFAGLPVQSGGDVFPLGPQSFVLPGPLASPYGSQPLDWTGYRNSPSAAVSSFSMQKMDLMAAYEAQIVRLEQIKVQLDGSLNISRLSSSFMAGQDAFLGGNIKSPMSHPVNSSLAAPSKAGFLSHVPNSSIRIDDEIASEISVAYDLDSARHGETIEVHILKKLEHFKKFDTVLDHSDHHYTNKKESSVQPSKGWVKKIQEEWKTLEEDLPDTIFVRVYETRMDLLRAVIVGAEGTPYHDGIFFFDVYFPSSYPSVPPHVHYHSGGLRLNPNLYNCGKVCLSLLNTWTGGKQEKWIPGVSTMLQVLVSLQGLILNSKPYFNEPGYASSVGSVHGEMASKDYNENTFLLSLKTMLYSMRRPPKHFEDFVFGHLFKHAHDILQACQTYLNGAQVGSIVKKDGVQNIQGNDRCSETFKRNLRGYVNTLVQAFAKIGVHDLEKYSIPLDDGDNK
ncbi:ubiquitin-conjugating enzyme [Ancistrocladus abbreviatus]